MRYLRCLQILAKCYRRIFTITSKYFKNVRKRSRKFHGGLIKLLPFWDPSKGSAAERLNSVVKWTEPILSQAKYSDSRMSYRQTKVMATQLKKDTKTINMRETFGSTSIPWREGRFMSLLAMNHSSRSINTQFFSELAVSFWYVKLKKTRMKKVECMFTCVRSNWAGVKT